MQAGIANNKSIGNKETCVSKLRKLSSWLASLCLIPRKVLWALQPPAAWPPGIFMEQCPGQKEKEHLAPRDPDSLVPKIRLWLFQKWPCLKMERNLKWPLLFSCGYGCHCPPLKGLVSFRGKKHKTKGRQSSASPWLFGLVVGKLAFPPHKNQGRPTKPNPNQSKPMTTEGSPETFSFPLPLGYEL